MWTKIAHFIIKYRVALIIVLAAITAFMGYHARRLQPTFTFSTLVSKKDPAQIAFLKFKETFGEDANSMVIGFEGKGLYELDNFRIYDQLIKEICQLEGLDTVVSMANVPKLSVNKRSKKFYLEPVFSSFPETQEELDEKLDYIRSLKIYENQLFEEKTGTSILLISINTNYVNSKARIGLVNEIVKLTKEACLKMSSEVVPHMAGLPYVRTNISTKVQNELKFFLILALFMTALVLLIFFRSLSAVLIPIIVIGVSVVWTMGTIVLFGFKMTILTGLIPPIIVIIGIPNCVYLLNKYHQEFVSKGDKIKALTSVIQKIGIVTFITNCTTATGFIVLLTAKITILKEFGIVAGLNVFSTFIISVILIPAIFSFLPDPNTRQLKHLKGVGLQKLLDGIGYIVQSRRSVIYIFTTVIVLISMVGAWKVYSVSYMVDDLPKEDPIKQDLAFLEDKFKGVMPLEIVLDTKDKNAFKKRSLMLKIDEFETFLASQPELTIPVSYLSFIKAANQAYYGDDPNFFGVPSNQDKGKILLYLARSGKNNSGQNAMNKFIDSTGQIRLSIKVADIGSKKMDTLINHTVIPKAIEIFEDENLNVNVDVKATGTTLLFIKGIKYLIYNLRQSLVIAIVLISIIMALLFRSSRMIILSLTTNLIPLLITGALMGYLDIPLKPSTALIFSIAFGISVDDSIHYLAKFRQELFANNFNVKDAVSISIRETGSSMIYTSIILFFGFIIFSWSSFLGTRMLGILTSTTLLMAMVTNLVLLPALLMTFDSGKRNKLTKKLIDTYNIQNDKD